MDLGDLGDAQLWQLMEDLWQEVAHMELNASPRGPPLGHWKTSTGGGDPDMEDKEVTFQGGGDGDPVSCYHGLQATLIERRMLAISSVPLPLD